MNQLFLTDENTKGLFPFTLTRSAADIRIGILTLREKWNLLGYDVQLVNDHSAVPAGATVISAATIPPSDSGKILEHPWQIFQWNAWALQQDFNLITNGRYSQPIPESVHVIKPANVFIEEGAKLSHCTINGETGPVYIGRNAEVMEGSFIRGPFSLCEGAILKMGSHIYGATTIGPFCTVGGEVKNSVIFGYSNKAHDGYLGDSVIGEWCNLGAGTSNSNVKNNAGEVRVFDIAKGEYVSTGLNKCGLLMGDYSRAAINTSFNTGTVVGVSANVFGEGLTPKYIPSYAWGSAGDQKYEFNKALDDILRWKKLKGEDLREPEKKRLKLIFDQI